MDWRHIPSLAALRAFEATARLGSLTAAAQALNVTHAAISQHIRALEADFGTALIQREGRSVGLTDTGRRFAADLAEGFGTIGRGVADLRSHLTGQPLRVSLTPSFTELWLMPRLGSFWADHPEIEIALMPTPQLVDLRRDGIDIAIRYGTGNWPDLAVAPLVADHSAVVGKPGLVPKGSTAAEMARHPWIFRPGQTERRQWATKIGLIDAETKISSFATERLILSAVRAGYGLSVQSLSLAHMDLESGALEILCDMDDPGLGYHVVTPKGQMAPRLKNFVDWLHREAADDV